MKAFLFIVICVVIAVVAIIPAKKREKMICVVEKTPSALSEFKKFASAAGDAFDDFCEWFTVKKGFDRETYFRKTNNDKLVPVIREKYGDLIAEVCREKGIPSHTDLVVTVIIKESSGNPDTVGAAGEIGLMQVKPAKAIEQHVDPSKLKDPYWNLVAGVGYLSDLLKEYDGDYVKVLVAYKHGMKGLSRVNAPEKTRYYQEAKSLLDVARERIASLE
jgi:hypothetical protein